jgi:hypothetical protein
VIIFGESPSSPQASPQYSQAQTSRGQKLLERSREGERKSLYRARRLDVCSVVNGVATVEAVVDAVGDIEGLSGSSASSAHVSGYITKVPQERDAGITRDMPNFFIQNCCIATLSCYNPVTVEFTGVHVSVGT